MGEEQVVEGRKVFQSAGVPVFRTPEPAVEVFAHVSSFYRNQRMLMQAPGPLSGQPSPDVEAASRIIEAALEAGLTVLLSAIRKRCSRPFRSLSHAH